MFGFLKSKPVLNEEDFQFQIETYKWLLTYFGGDDFYKTTQLVQPTKTFFPMNLGDHDTVPVIFEKIKCYAGLESWPCQLIAQEEGVNPHIAPTLLVKDVPIDPQGTFTVDESNEAIITYNPAMVSNPNALIATFAHELAHYLTATAQEPPPGGWENWEFATDIAATFLGFGLFMANTCFNFSQFSSVDELGWQCSTTGYLSEAEHCMALALFLSLKQIHKDEALRFLKPNLKKLIKRCFVEIDQRDIVNLLSKVKYVEPIDLN